MVATRSCDWCVFAETICPPLRGVKQLVLTVGRINTGNQERRAVLTVVIARLLEGIQWAILVDLADADDGVILKKHNRPSHSVLLVKLVCKQLGRIVFLLYRTTCGV